MGFWEGLCAFTALVILGLYGLILLSAKLGLMDDPVRIFYDRRPYRPESGDRYVPCGRGSGVSCRFPDGSEYGYNPGSGPPLPSGSPLPWNFSG